MSKKSPIKERILTYLEYRGISENQFYKDSTISRRVLKQESGLSEDNLIKFLEYDFDTNLTQRIRLDWLLRGEGDMMETYIHNQEIAFLDAEAEYGDKGAAVEKLITRLNQLNNQYTANLNEVTKAIKKLQDEE